MHPCLSESTDSRLDGVRVWSAHLPSLATAEVEELHARLDLAERTRATRFHFEQDRQHYIAARGLLRCLLGAVLDKPAGALVFEYGTHGKPALADATRDGSGIRFNLSHSADWAMFAVAEERDVGIDLEGAARLDRKEEDLFRLAARVLSPRELLIWHTLPVPLRHAAFLRAWTRKEAYAKATGQGVFAGFADIEVALDAAAPKMSLAIAASAGSDPLTSDWLVHDLPAPQGFVSALVVEHKSEESVAGCEGVVFAAAGHA